jgi:IS5 family transposase
LNEQLEQATILTEDTGTKPKQIVVDLGVQRRGCGQPARSDHPPGQVQELDGSTTALAQAQAGGGASEQSPETRHTIDRCWLKGATGDALHAVLCAAGYNIR